MDVNSGSRRCKNWLCIYDILTATTKWLDGEVVYLLRVDLLEHNFHRVRDVVRGTRLRGPGCARPVTARSSPRCAPVTRRSVPADQSTPTPLTLVVVESSIRKFAREDVAGETRWSQSVICPSRRHLVASPEPYKREPTGRESPPPPPRHRQVNLVARTINHSINANSYSPVSPFIVSPPRYTKTPLYNSRLSCSRQSSSHVRGQSCRYRSLLQQPPTDSILRIRLITSSDTVSGVSYRWRSHSIASPN